MSELLGILRLLSGILPRVPCVIPATLPYVNIHNLRIRGLLGDIRTLSIALPKYWDIPKYWEILLWNVPIFWEISINWDEKIGKIGSGNLKVTPKLPLFYFFLRVI